MAVTCELRRAEQVGGQGAGRMVGGGGHVHRAGWNCRHLLSVCVGPPVPDFSFGFGPGFELLIEWQAFH